MCVQQHDLSSSDHSFCGATVSSFCWTPGQHRAAAALDCMVLVLFTDKICFRSAVLGSMARRPASYNVILKLRPGLRDMLPCASLPSPRLPAHNPHFPFLSGKKCFQVTATIYLKCHMQRPMSLVRARPTKVILHSTITIKLKETMARTSLTCADIINH